MCSRLRFAGHTGCLTRAHRALLAPQPSEAAVVIACPGVNTNSHNSGMTLVTAPTDIWLEYADVKLDCVYCCFQITLSKKEQGGQPVRQRRRRVPPKKRRASEQMSTLRL